MTNIEKVLEIMEFSDYGALAQAFVMNALSAHAKLVSEAPIEALESMRGGFISPEAWQGVALEITEKLKTYS